MDAAPSLLETDEACAAAIARMGELDRDLARIEADKSERVSRAATAAELAASPLNEERAGLEKAVATYCAANRERLTSKGGSKTARFTTGEVAWKKRPDRVEVDETLVEKIIAKFKELRLKRFLHTTVSIDKGAVKKEPAKIKGIRGIRIEAGEEAFTITPLELPLVEPK